MMKKIIVLLTVLVVAINADAQIKLGIKAGLNVSDMSFSSKKGVGENIDDLFSNRTGWHLGMAMKMKFPLFPLTLQPELLFSTKGSNSSNEEHLTLNYIEIPINLQWGISLGKIRPYVELTPYFSYLVGSKLTGSTIILDAPNSWDGGLGLGVGIDIWKLQISGKYMWGLGKVSDLKRADNSEIISSLRNRSIQISLGYFL
jgi:hypothetical protein